ncbi:hypothetical protein BDY19DRAFT_973404 [Irpex rosettiformis]|uniref:Uncharacterized protein n=1 Tax=Irpex rosettiformis TaxID=378272 RepID=A0ACB8TQJ9_9APHY|nr:hypothetical protein BDY19DRAFT_973404 [Irpex rosettiformis]
MTTPGDKLRKTSLITYISQQTSSVSRIIISFLHACNQVDTHSPMILSMHPFPTNVRTHNDVCTK